VARDLSKCFRRTSGMMHGRIDYGLEYCEMAKPTTRRAKPLGNRHLQTGLFLNKG
jgi:hypothetical protein